MNARRPDPRRPVAAALAAGVSAAVLVGCGRVAADPALAVADRYYAALGASDTATACRLMTDSQRTGFEGGSCEQVMRFLLETDGPPGRRALQPRGMRSLGSGERQVIELRYEVAYRSGPRVDILTIAGTAGQPDSFRIDGIARQEARVVD